MILNIKKHLGAYIMLLSLLAICLVFGVLTEGIFFYPRNIALLARQTTIVGVLAIGMMFVIVAGHIDLSVGSVLGFCGTLAGVLQVWMGWPTLPTIILVILTGMICGAWHGYWVAYRRVPAFIITLGGLLIFKGAKFGLSKSMSIAPMNPSFSMLGQSYIPAAIGWILAICAITAVVVAILRKRKSKIKYNFKTVPFTVDAAKAVAISVLIVAAVFYLNKYKGIPAPVLIMVVLALIFAFVANSTVFGRSIYAIGGNLEASSLSGIKTKLTTLYIFIISGGLAAVAGIILTARLDAATPASGDTMELDAIAACIIGGTNLMGGSGKVSGVIVGALVMASLDNGMSLINLENYWQFVVKGLVLTFAVWASTMSSKTA